MLGQMKRAGGNNLGFLERALLGTLVTAHHPGKRAGEKAGGKKESLKKKILKLEERGEGKNTQAQVTND